MHQYKKQVTGYRLTVRTLDFQSKNVGSIPSNPNITNIKKEKKSNLIFLANKPNFYKKKSVFYDLCFVSFIAPNFVKNFTTALPLFKDLKKIQLKQSYLIFTWFYHMSVVEKKRKSVKFFVMPVTKKTTTQIKAPIAHKNWSKEQFFYSFYVVRIRFNSNFKDTNNVSSLNAGLLFALLAKKFFPVFETNILFLKSYKIMFDLKEPSFFKKLI